MTTEQDFKDKLDGSTFETVVAKSLKEIAWQLYINNKQL